jgi:hypothetical protein
MRIPPLALLLLGCLGGAIQAETREFVCKPARLDAPDREDMLAEVQKFAGHVADVHSLRVCRARGDYHIVVNTVRESLGDGSEHWHATSCSRKSSASSSSAATLVRRH